MAKLATIREACQLLKGGVITAVTHQTAVVARMLSDSKEGRGSFQPPIRGDNTVQATLRGEPLPVIRESFSGKPGDLWRHCVALEAELVACRAALAQLSAKLVENPVPVEPSAPLSVVRDMEARLVELLNHVAAHEAHRQYLETLLSDSQMQLQAMMQARQVFPAEGGRSLQPIVEEPPLLPFPLAVPQVARPTGVISSGGDGDGTPAPVISRRNSLPAKPRPSATGVVSSSEWS
jgi:hypothetical protein